MCFFFPQDYPSGSESENSMAGIISEVLKRKENVFDATYLSDSDSEGSLVDFINDGPISDGSWTPPSSAEMKKEVRLIVFILE